MKSSANITIHIGAKTFSDNFHLGLETNTTSVETLATEDVNVVSEIVAFYFDLLGNVVTCGLLSIIGMVTNMVNIIVFVRLGIFTESSNASLVGLAVADLCCVTSMLWLSICYAISLLEPPGLSWDPMEMMYLTAGWPHIMLAQITRMVTAYIALERCICVVFPFKVKSIFTSRRSLLAIASIFVCFGLSYSPIFIYQQMAFRFDSETNTTRLVFVTHPQWQLASDIVYYVNGITFNISAVVIVLICTTVTVTRVNLSKAWRESMNKDTSSKPVIPPTPQNVTSTSQADSNDSSQIRLPKEDNAKGPNRNQIVTSKMQREKKLVRVITIISVIFLICYIPELTSMIAFTIDPEIRMKGKQKNLASMIYSISYLMETFNSTINILIYYRMNSRYRHSIRALFGLK